MTTITITTQKAKYPGNLADEYLALKAEKAELAEREAALKDKILAAGESTIEGNFGRVVVSRRAPTIVVDYIKAAKDNLSQRVLEQYETMRQGSVTFNVRARVADAAPTA